MTYDTVRRRLLKQTLAAAAAVLSGCRWDSEAASPLGAPPSEPATPSTPAPAVPPTWRPNVPPLTVGTQASFDLASTLPASVARGGTFGVDSGGARLPGGMTLSVAGILAVGTAAIGTVTGVIFTYDAP
jgi:hypothetical protein